MAEYIAKDAVISLFEKWSDGYAYIEIPVQDAISQVSAIPPADVRPVVRGQWELDSDGIPHCTECGYVAPQRLFLQVQSLACTTQFIMSNYCPDCGSYNGGDADG